MDSNVSKNTNSHKFFKLQFDRETLGISVKDLLKQELLSVLDVYQQNLNIPVDLKFVDSILRRKISVCLSDLGQLPLEKEHQFLLPRNFISIMYSCPLGLILAAKINRSPQEIIEQLGNLFISQPDNIALKSQIVLWLAMTSSGWLNFYLDSKAIETWLERSLLLNSASATARDSSHLGTTDCLAKTSADLFSSQYIHARCCSLLRLAAREKLLVLNQDLLKTGWQIEQPATISWSDRQDNLWFTELSEYDLLKQLSIVTDSWVGDLGNLDWSKIAFCLSQSTAVFLADCRFLGVTKPQKAIARLGLIALVQYWLQKILREKLGVAAPQSL